MDSTGPVRWVKSVIASNRAVLRKIHGESFAQCAARLIRNWFDKRLVILLSEQDREPRTQLLCSDPRMASYAVKYLFPDRDGL